MGTIGFLHTSAAHVARFDALVHLVPGQHAVHVVDEALLSEATACGVAAVVPELEIRLQELWDLGVDAVVCTCSTLGAAAEDLGSESRVVVRVDRPMMRAAVTAGPRVVVLVALAATIDPTLYLLREEADGARVEVNAQVVLVPDAWGHFMAGRLGDYVNSIVRTGLEVSARADVIVLAQASMADAAEELRGCGVRVLASPEVAVEHVVAGLAPH